MISLLFIRHGATAGNLEKRYIGRTDEPLCSVGISQAAKLREKNFTADRLFISPMLRTRQTADILFPQTEKCIINDFRETDFGIFEGKTPDELSGCEEYRQWTETMCLTPIPGGESVAEFKLRCCKAFENAVMEIPENSTAAFVVHGGVIMAIMEKFAVPGRSFYEYHIGNCEYIFCEFDRSIYKMRKL